MTATSPSELGARAGEALAKGNIAEAERLFRECIAAQPDNGLWHRNLGVLLNARGKHAEAESYLRSAAALINDVATHNALAETLIELGRPDEACQLMQKATAEHPGSVQSWILLGAAASEEDMAHESLQKALALEPTNENALSKLSSLMSGENPAPAIEAYRRALDHTAQDWGLRTRLLADLITLTEMQGRVMHGLPHRLARDSNDIGIQFAVEELKAYAEAAAKWAEANPENPEPWLNQAYAAYARGHFEDAEAYFAFTRDPSPRAGSDPRQIADVVTFNTAFYEEMDRLPAAEITSGLPPVTVIRKAALTSGHVLFLSCDYGYFNLYAKPLLRSLADHLPGAQVHVHLMDAGEQFNSAADEFIGALPLSAKLTAEDTPHLGQLSWAAKLYYHAVRFVRLFQFLNAGTCCYWMMDVDALVHGDPHAAFDKLGGVDLALAVQPYTLEPWHRFVAGLIGVRPSHAGLRYMKLVAAAVAALYRRGDLRWGIDQFLLSVAFDFLARRDKAPQIKMLHEDTLDFGRWGYGTAAPFWLKSGRQKRVALHSARAEPAAANESPYVTELRKYL